MADPIQIRDLLRRVRRIHIRSRREVAEYLAGSFRSAFRGPGIEFREVRPYRAGDGVERIDWNVSARRGSLHVKTFEEERELCVLLLVDRSASTAFGSRSAGKCDVMAEFCGLVAYSAVVNHDRVGLVLFSDRVEKYLPPRRSENQVLRILRELLLPPEEGRGTSIGAALDFLGRVHRKRAVVFLLSDFLDQGYEARLPPAARRHDLVAVRVWDPRERTLPPGGVLRLRDLETGRVFHADLSNGRVREAYAQAAAERERALRKGLASRGVDLLEIEAGDAPAVKLAAFFQARSRRRGRT